MKRRIPDIVFTLALGLIAGSCSRTPSATPQPSALTVREAMSWLPSTTETVIVARGPLDPPSVDGSDPVLRIAHGAAFGVAREDLLRPLSEARVRFAVEGARRFRAPRGLGLGPYEGVHIAAFDDEAEPVIAAFLRGLTASGAVAHRVDAFEAFTLRYPLEDDEWSLTVIHPRPGVIIVATDEELLGEVIDRSRGARAGDPFPPSLPQWSAVDTSARIWAIRQYRRTDSEADPTSPFADRHAGSERDSLAIGLTVSIGEGSAPRVVIHYFSESATAVDIARRLWSHPSEGMTPVIERAGPQGVRIVAAPSTRSGRGMLLFLVLAALGHMVYL